MAHPVLIALVGIDGSGKSSQAARPSAAWLTMVRHPRRSSFKGARRPAQGGPDRPPACAAPTASTCSAGRSTPFVEGDGALARESPRALLVAHFTRPDAGDGTVTTYCQYAVMAARGDRGIRLTRFLLRASFPKTRFSSASSRWIRSGPNAGSRRGATTPSRWITCAPSTPPTGHCPSSPGSPSWIADGTEGRGRGRALHASRR